MSTTIYAEPSDLEMVRRIAANLDTKHRVSVAPTAHQVGELRVALADVRYTQKGRTHVTRGKLVVRRDELTRTQLVKAELSSGRKLTADDRADLVARAAARFLVGFLAAPKKRGKAVAIEADDDLFTARVVAMLRERGYAPKVVDDLDDHERSWGRLRLGVARIDLAKRAARLTATRAGFGDRYFQTTLRTTLPANATEEAACTKLANKLLAWFENAAGTM